MNIKTKASEIFKILDASAEKDIIFLNYENSFQLLIGVILSAQTTDRQVNEVLPELFKKYPRPADLGKALKNDVIDIIRPVGFFNVKASNIIKTAAAVQENFGGEVPQSMNSLLTLAGVGRKSANVVRGACFGLPAIIVDTHFARTVTRLGLSPSGSPEQIESNLASIVEDRHQYRFSMLLNKLGRDFCKSRKPDCPNCPLRNLCEYPDENKENETP